MFVRISIWISADSGIHYFQRILVSRAIFYYFYFFLISLLILSLSSTIIKDSLIRYPFWISIVKQKMKMAFVERLEYLQIDYITPRKKIVLLYEQT